MTRGNARELAVHLIYSREFTGETPEAVIERRLEEGYYETLAQELEIYTERPTNRQVKYLSTVVSGVAGMEEQLNEAINRHSIGWDVKRISRLMRVIMQLAIYEIEQVEDVPEGVAVSEAVRLAKKYNEEMGKFVNGILGAYVRSRKAAEAPETPVEAPAEEN